MGNQISQQMLTFVQSILLGLAAGVLYDLLRPFRLRRPGLTALLDAGYCLSVGAGAFLFLLRRGEGELRGFLVLGAVGGAGAVFLCVFSSVAANLGVLGGNTGVSGAFAVDSAVVGEKNLHKIGATRKKSLLFYPKMLYNDKETISQRRRTRWKRPGEEKRSRFGQDR